MRPVGLAPKSAGKPGQPEKLTGLGKGKPAGADAEGDVAEHVAQGSAWLRHHTSALRAGLKGIARRRLKAGAAVVCRVE